MKMFSKEGMEMMDVRSIERDGDRLIIKGKVMGSINTVIVIEPENSWQAFRLLGLFLLLRMPVILVKGYFRSRQPAKRAS